MPRDNFSKPVKSKCAARVGYLCSNPDCQALTSGPGFGNEDTVNTGVASHICAASRDGPRFDANQTPEERSSIENAIWLCQTCAKLIDPYKATEPTPETLRKWKESAEEFARGRGPLVGAPSIEIFEKLGRRLPELGQDVDSTSEQAREYTIRVRNQQQLTLSSIRIRLQVPEFWTRMPEVAYSPPGVSTSCSILDAVARAKSGTPIVRDEVPVISCTATIEIERLEKGQYVDISVSLAGSVTSDPAMIDGSNGEGTLLFFVVSQCNFDWKGVSKMASCLLAINWNPVTRQMTIPSREPVVERPLTVYLSCEPIKFVHARGANRSSDSIDNQNHVSRIDGPELSVLLLQGSLASPTDRDMEFDVFFDVPPGRFPPHGRFAQLRLLHSVRQGEKRV